MCWVSWSLGNNFEVGRFLQIQPITLYTYCIKVQVATHSPGGKQECAEPRAPNPLNPRFKASSTPLPSRGTRLFFCPPSPLPPCPSSKEERKRERKEEERRRRIPKEGRGMGWPNQRSNGRQGHGQGTAPISTVKSL
jgi:hypothetical protein